jgi:DNA-binding ferritin-like protein
MDKKLIIRMKKALGGIDRRFPPNLAQLASLINAMNGQFHDIHFKANDTNIGTKGHWDDLHHILEGYYEHLQDDYDPAVEWAIAAGLDPGATNNSASAIGYVGMERSVFEGYQYNEALKLVYDNIALLCNVATAVNNSFEDDAFGIAVKNYLGNFLEYWVFEMKFRIERRLNS